MKLSRSDLMKIHNLARNKMKEENPNKVGGNEAFVSYCWIESLKDFLAKEGLELYAFPINHNESVADPNKYLDVSGKILTR